MAIAIKNVPVLKKSVADRFDKKAKDSYAKKSTVKFKKQLTTSSKILAKSKL